MATLSNMYLRLNNLDPRVKAELFRKGGRHRLLVFVDGVRKGYLTRAKDSTRFALWVDGWHWSPEYTPTEFELEIKTYLCKHPLY